MNLLTYCICLDWTGADEDKTDEFVWEDNWDDDNVEDDFSKQLRWASIKYLCLCTLLLATGVLTFKEFWAIKNKQIDEQ